MEQKTYLARGSQGGRGAGAMLHGNVPIGARACQVYFKGVGCWGQLFRVTSVVWCGDCHRAVVHTPRTAPSFLNATPPR